MIDLDKVRRDTPATATLAHLNNAGAALMPAPVVDAMHGYIDLEAAIGGYESAAKEAEKLDSVYDSVARMIGADRSEIALVENATVAWQMAFYSIQFQPGDRILTVEAEYAANYVAYLQMAKRTGVVIDVIPSDYSGAADVAALRSMIDDKVKLISATWIPTNGGLVNPAIEIGALAREHGILYLLDACQAVGQMPVDVEELRCDFLSATGRKFLRGPRGSGFLYVRKSVMDRFEPPMIDHFAAPWVEQGKYELRDDARRYENWENNYAARLGLGVAVDYALDLGLQNIQDRAWALAETMRQDLGKIPGVQVRDLGDRRAAIVTFSVDGVDPGDVKIAMAAENINVSVSGGSSTLIDAEKRGLPSLVRASPHYYNSEDEIERLVKTVRSLI